MNISRKQALVALVAGVLPWVGRRAYAADLKPAPTPTPTPPKSAPQTEVDALKRRVEALEKQLANQVAFSNDGNGNLTLKAPGQLTLAASSTLTIKGSTINLN
jgi:hypothetical protein